MSLKEYQKRALKMQKEYQKFLMLLEKYNRKQTEIINRFIKNLEERKISEIRNKINSYG